MDCEKKGLFIKIARPEVMMCDWIRASRWFVKLRWVGSGPTGFRSRKKEPTLAGGHRGRRRGDLGRTVRRREDKKKANRRIAQCVEPLQACQAQGVETGGLDEEAMGIVTVALVGIATATTAEGVGAEDGLLLGRLVTVWLG